MTHSMTPSPQQPPLTSKQRRLLDALAAHLAEHGTMPTAHDLAVVAGLQSSDVVRYELGCLVVKGYIHAAPGQPGEISIHDERV